MTDMICLKIVGCEPLVDDPKVCVDIPDELWMPLNYIPSYISRLIDNKEVAKLIITPCPGQKISHLIKKKNTNKDRQKQKKKESKPDKQDKPQTSSKPQSKQMTLEELIDKLNRRMRL